MINSKKIQIDLMESHENAYYIWEKRKFTNLPLLHFDAHLDISTDTISGLHFGNFLYMAIKKRIISELHWIIPGSMEDFKKDFIIIKKILSELVSQDVIINNYSTNTEIDYSEGKIESILYGIPFYIYPIDNLSLMDKQVLVDIDVDFFVIDRIKHNNNLINIGKRKQWIKPSKFINLIKKNILDTNQITIAYSVYGGYTPLIYKSIGHEIAKNLGYSADSIDKKILAGNLFLKFINFLNKNNFPEGRKYYREVIKLDPSYLVAENTYGWLYLKKRNLKNAKREFIKMLKINKQDIYSLMGLAIICIFERELIKSSILFETILKLQRNDSISIVYLAYINFKLKKIKKAKQLLLTYKHFYSKNFFIELLLARLYEKEKRIDLSDKHYTSAFNCGIVREIPLGLESLMEDEK